MTENLIDLTFALSLAENCARRAGALLRETQRESLQVGYKGPLDIVTDADRRSEAFIVREILNAYPDHHIVGEEGGGMGAALSSTQYRWYVDPLDGTRNFAHGLPHFCVSIAMTGLDGLPLIGVIYDPVRDECF